ncbi:MAG: hypothetical protein JOZ69_24500 [Myxococcales bacterium]|nr:hypothetical protein [Myxococcales bacterium]
MHQPSRSGSAVGGAARARSRRRGGLNPFSSPSIIYGPEYHAPQDLERLRGRRLSATRSLALREFALGFGGRERFVRREPRRRVHGLTGAGGRPPRRTHTA